jgi:AcrR family transcriptional regulator
MPAASSTSRAPRRDARENRAAILAAATTAIADDAQASLDAIASRAGLTRRALYGHFDDRDALVREVIAAGAVRFNAIAARVHDDDAPLALARLASALWAEAAHVQATAAIALDDTHVTDTAAALAPLRRRIDEVVRRGQRDGTLRGDVERATLARLIEQTGRAVVTQLDAASADARLTAVRAVLGIAGLSWREAATLIAAHPELARGEEPHDPEVSA